MADNHTPHDPAGAEQDPSASTQMFRAFVREGETVPAQSSRSTGLVVGLIGAAALVIALLVVLIWF